MENVATSTYGIRITLKIIAVFLTVTTVSCQPKRANIKTSTPFVTAKPGANITLTCLAYRISVDPVFNWVIWKFRGAELQDTERIRINEKYNGDTGNFTISITNVTGDDEGVYACYVLSEGMKGMTLNTTLTVEAIPTVTRAIQGYKTWTRPFSYETSRKRLKKKTECCRLLRRLIKSQTCIPISLRRLTAEIETLQRNGKISQAGHDQLLQIVHKILRKRRNA